MRTRAAGFFWKGTGRVAWLAMLMGGNQDAPGRRPSLESVIYKVIVEKTPVGDNDAILTGLGVSHTF